MLKKYLLIILFFITLVPSVKAQEGFSDASDTTFWNFGFYASPDYSYRFCTGNSDRGVSSGDLDNLEIPKLPSYTLGINMTRQLNRILYIQTGIIYQNKGYKTNTQQDTVLDLYDHFLYAKEYTGVTRYHAIDIPVILRIKMFKAGSVQFNAGLGVAPEFYFCKSTLQVFSDHTERDVAPAERFYDLKGIFNLNIDIPLSDNLSLALEPNIGYNILGLEDAFDKGIKRNMYTAGLGIQLSYKVTDQSIYDYYYMHIYKKPAKSTF